MRVTTVALALGFVLWGMPAAAQVPTWSDETPVGGNPSARTSFASSFYLDGGVPFLVVHGGYDGANSLSDEWIVDLSTSPFTAAAGPGGGPDLAAHVGNYDGVYDEMITVMGANYTLGQINPNTWSLSPLQTVPGWVDFGAAAGPTARYRLAAVYVPNTAANVPGTSGAGAVVIFGGMSATGNSIADPWYMDVTTLAWTQIGGAGDLEFGDPQPSARQDMAYCWDAVNERILFFHGQLWSPGTYYDEVWSLTYLGGNAWLWAEVNPTGTGPSPRIAPAAAACGARAVFFGGYEVASGTYQEDYYSLDLTLGSERWAAIGASGGPPPARGFQGAAYDTVNNRFIMVLGNDSAGLMADCWALTPPFDPTAPAAPTTLYANTPAATAQAGLPSPVVNLDTWAPVFSAVYNDGTVGDEATLYRIQVDDNNDFSSTTWDSGANGTALAAPVAAGARCGDITYAGGGLTALTTYYWRIKFWDQGNNEGAWSENPLSTTTFTIDPTLVPLAPTVLYCNTLAAGAQAGLASPVTNLDSWTPVFSAIYNDDVVEQAPSTQYQLQVATSSNFASGMMWDSGQIAMVVADGGRCPDIAYAGAQLARSATYYWRIRFYDLNGAGAWSEDPTSTTTFTIDPAPSPPLAPTVLFCNTPADTAQAGLLNPTDLNTWTPVFSAVHNDLDDESTTQYWIQVATSNDFSTGVVWDSGAVNLVVAPAARSSSITHGGVVLTPSTTYYWRIRFYDANGAGAWSQDPTSTNTFTINPTSSASGDPPLAPTVLYCDTPAATAQSGQTNPTALDTWTPVFSAIHNDVDGNSSTMCWIQVATSDDFTTGVVWDSGANRLVVANGARSADIAYGGTILSNGPIYYWRILFYDVNGRGTWSETTSTNTFTINALGPSPGNIPTAPTSLFVNTPANGAQTGQTNPSGMDTWLPVFSAVYNEPDGDPSIQVWVQASTVSDFSSALIWDSNWQTLAVANGSRCSDISYGGGNLSSGTTYYWRIRFRDADGLGLWSETTGTNTFSVNPPTSSPPVGVSTTIGPVGRRGNSASGGGCFSAGFLPWGLSPGEGAFLLVLGLLAAALWKRTGHP